MGNSQQMPTVVQLRKFWVEKMKQTKGFEQMKVLLERETGIEPATNGLGSRYSTIELLPLRLQLYCRRGVRGSAS